MPFDAHSKGSGCQDWCGLGNWIDADRTDQIFVPNGILFPTLSHVLGHGNHLEGVVPRGEVETGKPRARMSSIWGGCF